MAVTPGARFATYEIADVIGKGGMGEVYRAHDTKLERDVAIKVLPETFAADENRLARFRREAKTLASLNHPNIAQIYGLEEGDGTTALVMELVDGPTLADRIEHGPLPPDEALNVAMQIADALEAAHEQGIVHRDLKPANVKVRPDGTVKVLDFGIAKAFDVQSALSGGPQAPSLTTPAMTQAGILLGTAAYMSPEQARGKPVDRRTDIWAFGCVLYEMLTGQPAFGGEDVPLTLARVLAHDTDMDSVPGTISLAVRHTIGLCLQKDPAKRISDIRDVRLALRGVFEAVPGGVSAGTPVSSPSFWRRPLPIAIAALALGGAIAAAAVWLVTRPPPAPLNRFVHILPDGQGFRNPTRGMIALSPDGRRFAYNTTDGLYLRAMDDTVARPVVGGEDIGGTPFFSPDGQSIGWFEFTFEMKRVSINGGAAVTVTNIGGPPYGASWAANDDVFWGEAGGIFRVPASGGEAELIVPAADDELLHAGQLLPDRDTLLFSIATNGVDWDAGEIVAESLSTHERTVLVTGGSDGRYLPTGHLVYAFEDKLFAIPFDPDSLTVSGRAVQVAQGVMRATQTAAANFAVAEDGTLVYVAGNAAGGSVPVWVDREGREEPISIAPGDYVSVRISPDGSRAAIGERSRPSDIWVWNFAAETRERLIVGEAGGGTPIWHPEGTRIAYMDGAGDIDSKAANNTGNPERLAAGLPTESFPYFFTSSGTDLVVGEFLNGGANIVQLTIDGEAEPRTLFGASYDEVNAALSPNGRWLAYSSNESGTAEVYVRPFPNVDDDRVPISNAGGVWPVWSADGRELFYVQRRPGAVKMMSVSIEATDSEFKFGEREALFDWAYFGERLRPYDVAPDGERFLVIGNPAIAAPQIVIVQNWLDELKRVVPTD